MCQSLRISICQTDIAWRDKCRNLDKLQACLEELVGHTDLLVLPEMFTTGFSMMPEQDAEPVDGPTVTLLREWSSRYQVALAGSYIASECSRHYNRAFFLTPDGESGFYDKRHLFRMGREDEHYTAGTEPAVFTYKGWNIRMLICYDLRFPVWSRNRHNDYDLLLYVANWPASRRMVWDVLLQARALENQSYVCGVNRVGCDGMGVLYNGGSAVYSPKGTLLAAADEREEVATVILQKAPLVQFRQKFPVWMDADDYTMDI